MLTSKEINSWQQQGFILKKNLLYRKDIDESVRFVKTMYSTKREDNYDFGSNGLLEFPTFSVLDKITLNERIISSVKKLLNCKDIVLSQADSWIKYGSNNFTKDSNNDQRMHMDYGNHMFTHVAEWDHPEAVSMIIYFSDIEVTGGGTAAVAREGDDDELYKMPYINMPGQNTNPFINDKSKAEEYFKTNNKELFEFREKLYDREIILTPKIGDILFYRLDLWHRGTPVNENQQRIVMNLVFKKRECYWINNWNPGVTKKMYYGKLEDLFTNLKPSQRSALGFPNTTEPYWTKTNISLIKDRYPKFNIQPYLCKL